MLKPIRYLVLFNNSIVFSTNNHGCIMVCAVFILYLLPGAKLSFIIVAWRGRQLVCFRGHAAIVLLPGVKEGGGV